jgi:hypothetical protein
MFHAFACNNDVIVWGSVLNERRAPDQRWEHGNVTCQGFEAAVLVHGVVKDIVDSISIGDTLAVRYHGSCWAFNRVLERVTAEGDSLFGTLAMQQYGAGYRAEVGSEVLLGLERGESAYYPGKYGFTFDTQFLDSISVEVHRCP